MIPGIVKQYKAGSSTTVELQYYSCFEDGRIGRTGIFAGATLLYIAQHHFFVAKYGAVVTSTSRLIMRRAFSSVERPLRHPELSLTVQV